MKLRLKLFSTVSFLAILLCGIFYYYFMTLSVGYSYTHYFDRELVTYQGRVDEKLPLIIIHADYNIGAEEYSFLGEILASKNYYVLVLQKIQDKKINRLPLEADSSNQAFVKDFSDLNQTLEGRSKEILYDLEHWIKKEAKQNNIHIDINNLILIGHGHGGDILMKFASLYPNMISKIISLDSRKYPFPRNQGLDILSFRAQDAVPDGAPDEVVLPEDGIQVIDLKGALHTDFCDRGSPEIKDKIQKLTLQFLRR